MRGVTWKKRFMGWEGTIKGDTEPLLIIEGGLCVTDLRENRKSKKYISPKHYKIVGLTIKEAKELAEDLVTGENSTKHELNRLVWIVEQTKTTTLIKSAEALIRKLKKL